MATLATALTYARAQAQTDSNGLTDTNGIIFANEGLLDFHRKLISKGVDASQLQESYRDGTLGVGTYLYPTDMWWLKSIEANFANTTAQDYKRAEQVDVSNLEGNVSVGWLRSNGSTMSPQFDDRGDWFEIFPTPVGANNVSQMFRIMYYLEPTEFTSTADTVSYPMDIDYRILAWRIASNFLYSQEKIQEGDAFNQKYEDKVADLVKTLSRGSQQPLQATGLGLDGYEF